MGYFDVANSPLLYVLVAAGVLYIVGLSAVFLRKSWRRCLELGISKEKLSAVARSSAVFTIVPSVSIVIGLFTLSTRSEERRVGKECRSRWSPYH